MSDVSVEDLWALAHARTAHVAEGAGLDAAPAALIELAACASVTSLDEQAMQAAMRRALDAGCDATQVHEVLSLVAGLGVHTLMIGSPLLARVLRERGDVALDAPLDPDRLALWRERVGDDPFWRSMEAELPGFLDAMLRLSPAAFSGFFSFCAVPWQTRSVRAVHKELIAMAVDATPTHRFAAGFRLHLANALALGASRRQVEEALAIAARAPQHRGNA